MSNRVIPVQLNETLNLLRAHRADIESGRLKDFIAVGQYEDTKDYVIYRTPINITDEINLSAQLSADTNARFAVAAVDSRVMPE